MANKPLTQQEFARMGANATNSKYPKEVRSQWAKKGPEALKAKHGEDYLKRRGEELNVARKASKKKNNILKLLGIER